MITTSRKGDSSRRVKRSSRRTEMAMIMVPMILIILALIFAVIFLYIYRFDIDNGESQAGDLNFDIIPITSDNIGMDFYLGRNATEQSLIDIYETPYSQGQLDISYVFNNNPSGLSFGVYNDSDVKLSGDPTVLKSSDTFIEWRYTFTPDGSEKYTLKYSLDNSAVNISNVRVQRVEWKVPTLTTSD